MTYKVKAILCFGLFTALMAAAPMTADETDVKQRAAVGTRAEPYEKQMARLKTRDEQVSKEERDVKHQKKDKKQKKTHGSAPKATSAQTAKSMRPLTLETKAYSKKAYYTSHPGAYQHPVAVSYLGDSVELMDGSIWVVSPSHAHKTINWFPTDLVVVTPNTKWLSSYSFCLTNQNTGESVFANLYLGPIDPAYNSVYTHWIVGIDYYRNVVYLEDGSVWSMSSFDAGVVDEWIINDVVIIGVNTGWLSSYNPNILINVNMLNYASGACVL